MFMPNEGVGVCQVAALQMSESGTLSKNTVEVEGAFVECAEILVGKGTFSRE